MNQQGIDAFNKFYASFANAFDLLNDRLQASHCLSCPTNMFAEQFSFISLAHEQTKAFTSFLAEQQSYQNSQYFHFKSSIPQLHKPAALSFAAGLPPPPPPGSIIAQGSGLSIQSTEQALQNWSTDNINPASVSDVPRWRGSDQQPQQQHFSCGFENENFKHFQFIEVDRMPCKVIDDLDSVCSDTAMPSLPPSVDNRHTHPSSTARLENKPEARVVEGADGAEDDEKWDDPCPLIRTIAFNGHFVATPTAQVEFKHDSVVRPSPPKWQEREAQNQRILQHHDSGSESSDNSENVRLISSDVHFVKGVQRPISFIEVVGEKQKGSNVRGKAHPHFHPLVHGEDALERDKERTEAWIETDRRRGLEQRKVGEDDDDDDVVCCGEFEEDVCRQSKKEMRELRGVIDGHFERQCCQLNGIKEAIYELRDGRHRT